MMNAGNKKLRLVLLALALFACSVMALGGTLANTNFVDKTNDNTKTEKQLTSDTNYAVSVTYSDTLNNINNGTELLTSDNKNPFANTIWCPGYTKVLYIKVTNAEKFPVECILTLNATNEEDGKLSNVMSYAVIENPTTIPNNWNNFKNASTQYHGSLSNENCTLLHITAENALTNNGTKTYALAIHMDEKANNDYQGQSMNLAFKLTVNANYAPGTTNLTNENFH